MSRLGKRQLDKLASFAGVFSAIVVPDKLLRSLIRAGMMESMSTKSDGFIVTTAAGFRAIADALDSGAIVRPPLEDWHKPRKPNSLPDSGDRKVEE